MLSFNEAAGIPRGRLGRQAHTGLTQERFNEAAGIPRGRPPGSRTDHSYLIKASMRPRVFPAEDMKRPGAVVP